MISFPWSKSRYLLGINIGIKSASAVLVEQNRGGNYPIKKLEINYPDSLKAEDNYQAIESILQSLLDYFNEELAFDYIPLQISVPDTLVSSAIFELEQMPKSQAMKNQLLAMRFQKDCHINMKNADISSQVIQNTKHTLYAITAPAALVSSIQSTIKHRHQNLQCIDKAIHYVFNHFYDQLLADASMLFINDEYWTLIIWNSDKNVVYFRSKLHSTDDQLINTADDVIRLLHTYQQTDQQQIKQLYVVKSGHTNKGISEIIGVRANMVVSPLSLINENKQLELPENELALFTAESR